MAARKASGDRLFTTRWVHVFEEDTAEGAVYRPEDDQIPLSRRPRERLEYSRRRVGADPDCRAGRSVRRATRHMEGRTARPRHPGPEGRTGAADRSPFPQASRDRDRTRVQRSVNIMAKKTAPAGTVDFEVSPRLPLLASVRAYMRGADMPVTRPLRIYTLDPSVSDRSGGMATVNVPYEQLTPGPVGSVFDVRIDKVPEPLVASAVDLDDPRVLITSGVVPSPSNGRFHLQMVYAVSTLTYATFRRALGRDIGWAVPAGADGSLAVDSEAVRLPGPQRGLQPRYGRRFVRLFQRHRRSGGLHRPQRADLHGAQPRHHRPRDHPRTARRPALGVPAPDQRGRAGVPRSVRRRGRAAPSLHVPGRRRAGDPRIHEGRSRGDPC